MAYYNKYTAQYYNQIGQFVEVQFWNTTFSDTIKNLPLVSFKMEYANGNQDKFDPVIIGCRCIIVVRAKHDSADELNNETFYANAYDDWKVLAYVDGIQIFAGFITMDVEPYVLKDKPYNIVITATDGLGLLKNTALSDVSGVDFVGRNTLLEYICGALKKTNLDLNVRVCLNWYNAGQDDRYDVGSPDMLTQTTIHHRSMLEDVNGFYDCYTALERILGKWAVLYQWKGRWVISNRAELMYGDQWFTEYDSNGTTPVATWDLTGYQRVEKDINISPVNLDQLVSYQTPVKSVKTVYRYEIPENLFNNQRQQLLGAFIAPLSGSGYSAYELVGWGQYSGDPNGLSVYAGTKNAYLRTEFNTYDVETDRYYVVEADTAIATALGHEIRNDNDDFWVDAGDKMTIAITARLLTDQAGSDPIFLGRVAILKDGTSGSSAADWYTLNPGGDWVNNPFANFAQTNETGNQTEWVTYSTECDFFPANGTLYLFLGSGGVDNLNEAHFKDIEINYTPYVKGSRLSVKGDYWLTTQNTNIKDVIEEDVFISDAPKRILKGALWNAAGTALTNPDWYYLNNTENRHFKELVNLGRYRSQYVRQRRVEGTFKGTMMQPSSDPTNPIPLAFHKQFYITNLDNAYCLVPPLEIDFVKGLFRGTLMACFVSSTDLVTEGDTHTFNYIF
jgi:hypothetical protein